MADEVKVYKKALTEFQDDPANPNKGNKRGRALLESSVKELGAGRSLVADRDGNIVAGNKTREALLAQGVSEAIVIETDGKTPVIVRRTDWDINDKDGDARKYAYADNRVGELSLTWDESKVMEAVAGGLDLSNMFEATELDSLIKGDNGDEGSFEDRKKEGLDWRGRMGVKVITGALQERFIVPPFSVLDTRQGYWQERKRLWKSLLSDIVSDAGRDVVTFAAATQKDDFGQRVASCGGVASVFDPVMCELAYRWFCPPGGSVVDPFAGGAVRGVVASLLGHPYAGIDLRPEQVAVNVTQWGALVDLMSGKDEEDTSADPAPVNDPAALTPVQRRGELWLKRDDAFSIGTAGNGGKVRSCWTLAQQATQGLVTAGSRQSPQVNIVAGIAAEMLLPCRVHTPEGMIGPEVQAAVDAGAQLVQHKAGYNNVIISRAREDAAAKGWTEIPFGMECQEAVDATRKQVLNLPADAKRIVIPVGSGMSLAGVLWGLKDQGITIPVVGIQVGADPSKRLSKWAPSEWKSMVTLVKSDIDYHTEAPLQVIEGVRLDPIYEAKCIPHLQPGDCLWVVGRRATASASKTPVVTVGPTPQWVVGDSQEADTLLPADEEYDLVFSCPPYYDLEEYSDDPKDLSNLSSYEEFVAVYRRCIAAACSRLKENRFAVFVVGDIRDPSGGYRDFVGDTVQAFRDAGLHYYNDAILVNMIGSGSLRANNQFAGMRKLVKCHQNVLVFWKGDPRQVRANVAPVDVTFPGEGEQGVVADGDDVPALGS